MFNQKLKITQKHYKQFDTNSREFRVPFFLILWSASKLCVLCISEFELQDLNKEILLSNDHKLKINRNYNFLKQNDIREYLYTWERVNILKLFAYSIYMAFGA